MVQTHSNTAFIFFIAVNAFLMQTQWHPITNDSGYIPAGCEARRGTGEARTTGSAGGSRISRYLDTISTEMK